MKLPGPGTMYVVAAGATVLLVVAAALTASGIDTPRPRATDLPVLIARSDPSPVTSAAAEAIPGTRSGATTAAPAPSAPAPGTGGAPSLPSKGSPARQSAARPPAAAPPAPSSDPDHEVVVPPVREDNEHGTAPVPETPVPTPVPTPHE